MDDGLLLYVIIYMSYNLLKTVRFLAHPVNCGGDVKHLPSRPIFIGSRTTAFMSLYRIKNCQKTTQKSIKLLEVSSF